MSNSRTPPQEGTASHCREGKDKVARRETTVGESSQSSRSQSPTSAQAGSPRHEGAERQLHVRCQAARARNLKTTPQP